MPAARSVLGQQDHAGLQDEMLLGAGLEVQHAAQRDHELAHRRGVPVERAAARRLLEGHARGGDLAGQQIAVPPELELDPAVLEVRFRVVARPQADTLDHAGLLAPP